MSAIALIAAFAPMYLFVAVDGSGALDFARSFALYATTVLLVTLACHGPLRWPARIPQVAIAASWFTLIAVATISALQVAFDASGAASVLYNPWGDHQWSGGYRYYLHHYSPRASSFYLEPSHTGMAVNTAFFVLVATRARRLALAIVLAALAHLFAASASGVLLWILIVTWAALRRGENGLARPSQALVVTGIAVFATAIPVVGPRLADFDRQGSSGDYRLVQPLEAAPEFLRDYPLGNGLGSGQRVVAQYGLTQNRVDQEGQFGIDNGIYTVFFAMGLAAPLALACLGAVIATSPTTAPVTRIDRIALVGFVGSLCFATGAAFNPEISWMYLGGILAFRSPQRDNK